MNYAVVIPAAGQGKRMQAGHNKQFLVLEERPLIIHTASVFEQDPWCREIIVVANASEIYDMEELFEEWGIRKVKQVVVGGNERQNSVHEGLKRLLPEHRVVLVHDGARPFVEQEDIHRLVEQAEQTGAAVLGTKMKDTVKRTDGATVLETIDRSSLWAVQTPQAFQAAVVMEAYDYAAAHQIIGTDDTSLVEYMGRPVKIVEGSYDNIKLTTPEDMVVARAILQKRREGRK
ncbi:2-C-methyl-D-erythritol 4-phosphate cytidylyltransferase [Marinococcus sp. PL1-022]|jgi:2-C-methyl-D-erythritol 4-phosphate cytidylyltransferase|uniref:2-C-methyl-D-erythritol 4-phosphate cytidylyltransferase n=1 Tax=Marinococcus sp. PL1-022 TaxID=3095363 RepID=UPI0026224E04|nr:2-C-methyl-D-erythritol 4-phosphate cytidylyltransferase [Marinococcus sp. PL1-022]MDX6151356.1 2-C-methyl-D-erythritol 4-phosphate cytidylyltransferase [Marinococcus sp. PL1-022]